MLMQLHKSKWCLKRRYVLVEPLVMLSFWMTLIAKLNRVQLKLFDCKLM